MNWGSVVLSAVVALLLLGPSQGFTWTPCDQDQVRFTPTTVSLTPDPLVAGTPAKFTVTGKAPFDVADGSLLINVFMEDSPYPIYFETDSLCDKTQCPIKEGDITIDVIEELPPIVPPGQYTVQIIAKAADETELMCVSVVVEITLPTFSSKAEEEGHVMRTRRLLMPVA